MGRNTLNASFWIRDMIKVKLTKKIFFLVFLATLSLFFSLNAHRIESLEYFSFDVSQRTTIKNFILH